MRATDSVLPDHVYNKAPVVANADVYPFANVEIFVCASAAFSVGSNFSYEDLPLNELVPSWKSPPC